LPQIALVGVGFSRNQELVASESTLRFPQGPLLHDQFELMKAA